MLHLNAPKWSSPQKPFLESNDPQDRKKRILLDKCLLMLIDKDRQGMTRIKIKMFGDHS